MTTYGDQVITGSADHGLRIYNMSNGSHVRQLFSKRYGHKEWVSCVDTCSDGRVLSGAMDGMLCLWDRRIVKCVDLAGHNGTISCVKVDDRDVAISGSYDKSCVVWDLNR
jgi:F-box/WD-40 domain protein 7